MTDRLALVRELGVIVTNETEWVGEVGVDRHKVTIPDKVRGIELPFTSDDWMQIATRKGQSYVGGCCSNMSLLQDEVNGVFRDGGYADTGTLLRMSEMARGHEGFECLGHVDDEGFEKLVDQWRKGESWVREQQPKESPVTEVSLDPWFKFAVAFNAVEPYLAPDSMDTPKIRYPRESDEQRLVGQLAGAMQRMDWADMFHNEDDPPGEKDQHEAHRRLNQAKVLVPMKRLLALVEAETWPFEGWALVQEGTDDILNDRRGLCLYQAREYAEEAHERFRRYAREEIAREARWKESGREDKDPFWAKIHPEVVAVTVTADGKVEVHRDVSH